MRTKSARDRTAYQKQWRALNRDRVNEYSKRYRANNPGVSAHHNTLFRFRKYGLTPDAYTAMLAGQSGRCAICRCMLDLKAGRGVGAACIDHCHKTGRVRGVLCTNCNHGVGKFRDDPALLLAAVEYLR
jgi:hypothetical protein